MSLRPNDTKRKIMRLNIKKHRQIILQHLMNENDFVLIPNIISIHNKLQKNAIKNNCSLKIDFGARKILKNDRKNLVLKDVDQEVIKVQSISSNQIISVGSNKYVFNPLTDQKNRDPKEKSSHLASVKFLNMCDVDDIFTNYLSEKVEINGNQFNPNLRTMTSLKKKKQNCPDKKFKNSRERVYRKFLRLTFIKIQQILYENLKNTNRLQPKVKILQKAKEECNLLKIQEKELLMRKDTLRRFNSFLKQKLKTAHSFD